MDGCRREFQIDAIVKLIVGIKLMRCWLTAVINWTLVSFFSVAINIKSDINIALKSGSTNGLCYLKHI